MDSAAGSVLMRLSDLQDARVRTLDGETLGRVHEVHVEKGRVVALTCGPGSFIERLTAKKHGRRIPWECVRRISPKEVLVVPDPPQRLVRKSGASRTRQGTRRPSAPRSKR
jgi:sporulation protein YlmC with PRC-barrel domain